MADPVASLCRKEPPSATLLRAESPNELARIRAMRRETYERRSGLLVDDEVSTDSRSFLFALCRQDVILASGRVLPLPDEAAGIGQFDHPAAGEHGMDTEVGRVAVAARGSSRLVLVTLALGASWMVQHTPHETFIAYCRPRLARLYEYVGARDLGVQVTRVGSDVPYRFVVGRFEVAAERALRLLSLDSATPYLRPPTALAGAA